MLRDIPRPGTWGYTGPTLEVGFVDIGFPPGFWGNEGGGRYDGDIFMPKAGAGGVWTEGDNKGSGIPVDPLTPLVATVTPTGEIIIGHANDSGVPVYSAGPGAANTLQNNGLLPLLVIGVVAFLLLRK